MVRTSRSAILLKRARAMRREPTFTERRLWEFIRDRRLGGWKWRRQAPIGPFIADFLCDQARLIVELDGASHDERCAYDEDRTLRLARYGFVVLRLQNDEVLSDSSGACARILAACGGDCRRLAVEAAEAEPPSPYPLPPGEGF